MDIIWLTNSVSRQFLVNAVATISEQQFTINNNVVNDLVSKNGTTNSPTNRSNENLYTKKLINSIRGNVACAHRNGFCGDTDNYLYQPNSDPTQLQLKPQPQQQIQQQSMLQRYQLPNIVARTINFNAMGNTVNLDIENSGTVSTYDCDSNNATKTITSHSDYGSTNNFLTEHNVKNDNCNYNENNTNTNKRSIYNGSTNTISAPITSNTDLCHKHSHSNRISCDSPMNIAQISAKTVFPAQFDNYAKTNRNHNQWWKNLVIVICYLFLLSSSLRICSANKHEGNCWFFVPFF